MLKDGILEIVEERNKFCGGSQEQTMNGLYHPIPKEVFQDTNQFTCWAAALESWMSVTPESPLSWAIKTQDDAIREYEYFCEGETGSNVIKGFRWFAAAMGMSFDVFNPAKNLSAAYVYEKLESKGYLYVFFVGHPELGNGHAHASVIYGISNHETQDCTIAVMDPWNAGLIPSKSFREYQRAEEILIAWLEYSEEEKVNAADKGAAQSIVSPEQKDGFPASLELMTEN